ncbi:MAG: DUF1080 domain-containing protein [Flavobacteriaceae bacterium]
MKKICITAALVLTILSCKEKVKEATANEDVTVTEAVEETPTIDAWVPLTINDWEAFRGGEVPKFWQVEDGAIVFHPPTAEERKNADGSKQSFNLVTKDAYTSFVLSFEWKISEAGNSGVLWGVSEDAKFKEPYHSGLEIQVLDNDKHPDGKNGTSHQAGALYDLVSPSEDATKPVGEWNTAIITVDHNTNTGSSVLNGVEVATFPVGGSELDALLVGSKFDGWDGFGKSKTGKIALQDHGDMISYRNIKIKML